MVFEDKGAESVELKPSNMELSKVLMEKSAGTQIYMTLGHYFPSQNSPKRDPTPLTYGDKLDVVPGLVLPGILVLSSLRKTQKLRSPGKMLFQPEVETWSYSDCIPHHTIRAYQRPEYILTGFFRTSHWSRGC